MNLLQCYLTNNDCYKAGKTIKPKGIVVHSTGANNKALNRYIQPSDTRQEVTKLLGVNSYNNHWNKPGIHKCVHAFVGAAAQGQVLAVQTLPWNMRAWGAGNGRYGSYNDSHIHIEICEDSLVDKQYLDEVLEVASALCRQLCQTYNLSVDSIVSHAEAHRRGYASNHSDPEHWLNRHGITMDDFRAMVRSGAEYSAYKVRVATAALNVRKGPGTAYGIATVVRKNDVYTIVDTTGNWGRLKSGAGWINLKYTSKV